MADSMLKRTPVSRRFLESRQDAISLLVLVVVFSALVLPTLYRAAPTALQSDFEGFHRPQIEFFIHHPTSIFHYPATTPMIPGFHVAFGSIARLLGYENLRGNLVPLRLVSISLAYGFVVVIWAVVRRLTEDGRLAAVMCLPAVGSLYLTSSATWIVTDHVAALLYVISLGILLRPNPSPVSFGLSTALLTAVRQVYLPVASALVLPTAVAWLRGKAPIQLVLRRTASLVPAMLVAAVFLFEWKGLTPLGYQARFSAVPSSIAVTMLHGVALIGVLGAPFLVLLLSNRSIYSLTSIGACVAIGSTLGVCLWLFSPSSFDLSMFRFGSVIWSVAQHSPLLFGRAILLLPLAALGASVVTIIILGASRRSTVDYELVAFALYFCGYVLQPNPWQRYLELPILCTLAVHSARSRPFSAPGVRLVGLFGVLSSVLTATRLYAPLN